VPDSVRDPLGYYRNNTVNSHALIETAVKKGVRHFIFSSTAASLWQSRAHAGARGRSHGADIPLRFLETDDRDHAGDAGAAHGLRHVILRYFNVAGVDPLGRSGQSTRGATHLIKIAVETALGLRPTLSVSGTDYPTPDGTWIRDYIRVSDLITAHRDALAYLRAGGTSTTLNCGYGRGFSVLEVIGSVKRISSVDFKVEFTGRRAGDPAQLVAACNRVRAAFKWQPRFNDLPTIVSHALTWERKLSKRAG
jgi:UDP-glucose 4-epimerase